MIYDLNENEENLMNVFTEYLFVNYQKTSERNKVEFFFRERMDEIFKTITLKSNKLTIMRKIKDFITTFILDNKSEVLQKKEHYNKSIMHYFRILYEKWENDLPDEYKFDYCDRSCLNKHLNIGLYTYLYNDIKL